MKQNRREYLSAMGVSAVLTGLAPLLRAAEAVEQSPPHVATNTYPSAGLTLLLPAAVLQESSLRWRRRVKEQRRP